MTLELLKILFEELQTEPSVNSINKLYLAKKKIAILACSIIP